MGSGSSSQLRRRKATSTQETTPVSVLVSSENVAASKDRYDDFASDERAASANDGLLNVRSRGVSSWVMQQQPNEPQDDARPIGSLQDGDVAVSEETAFHDTLVRAAHQLRARQRDSNAGISKAEMEDLVLLTRELENLKQMMKRSQFTVEGTWNILEKEGMVDRFGQQLYDELLTRNPRLRVYFYGVDIEEQSKSLLRMVGTAVHFYEKPQVTVDMFTKAGARHRGYGVNGVIFAEMRNAFFKVFPKFVGSDVFEASEEEWKKFWKLVLELLQHGSESPEGERYGKMHEDHTFKKLQADFKLINDRQSRCDTRHQFVGVMYGKAIEMYGDLSMFEALKDLRASRRVFQAFVDLINNIHDKEHSDEYMRELGGRHTAYNVTVENLRSFTEPFLFTCRHFLPDEWNVAVESRFYWMFQHMVEGISAGMVSGINSMENMRAPSNSVTFGLMFTDIEASTKLWGNDPEAMSLAVKNHHAMIRRLIADYGAYEVKTVGDSFIIATKDVLVAVKLSLGIQLELMRMAPIAPGFQMVADTEGSGSPQSWDDRTLRVRIGVEHCTEATATYDSIHRRYDYYGPSVNRCARIESAACGGQILLSRQSFQHLKSIPEFHDEPCPHSFRTLKLTNAPPKLDDRGLDHFIAVSDVGLVSLKGIAEPVHLVSLVPRCLAGRQFVDKVSKIES
ncbi:oxygen-sensing adenylate cyclase [Novymonas esmeraldas]|uniref:Oxygen-sensing adenylate cyclase n=1 Tax=Novymonas esmeraldas TaxID=1808958 RepID=A0AAW0EVA5_9TRYP